MMNNRFNLSIEPHTVSWVSTFGDHSTRYIQHRSDEVVNASWSFADGVEVKVRQQPERRWTYNSSRRQPDTEVVRHDKKARVYVSGGEAFNLAEDLANRTRRPHSAWKAPVLEALARIGIVPTRISWSQSAGCSMCPCSPGFILEGVPEAKRCDIWITLPNAPTVDESKPAREFVLS